MWGSVPPGWWDNHDNCGAKNTQTLLSLFLWILTEHISVANCHKKYNKLHRCYSIKGCRSLFPMCWFGTFWSLPGPPYSSIQTETTALQKMYQGYIFTYLIWLNTQAPVLVSLPHSHHLSGSEMGSQHWLKLTKRPNRGCIICTSWESWTCNRSCSPPEHGMQR